MSFMWNQVGLKRQLEDAHKSKTQLRGWFHQKKRFPIHPLFQDSYVQGSSGLPFQCEICFKTFKKNWFLKRHSVVHTKEKPFECHICGLRVSLKDSLRMHIKAKHEQLRGWFHQNKRFPIHPLFQDSYVHGSDRFQCEICFKPFKESWALKRHSVVHTKEKFACHFCGGKFSTKDYLRLHMKAKHNQ